MENLTPPPAETEQDATFKPNAELREPSSYELMILMGLQQKPVYMGTVPAGVVAERRARNKRARASRRINRGAKR